MTVDAAVTLSADKINTLAVMQVTGDQCFSISTCRLSIKRNHLHVTNQTHG